MVSPMCSHTLNPGSHMPVGTSSACIQTLRPGTHVTLREAAPPGCGRSGRKMAGRPHSAGVGHVELLALDDRVKRRPSWSGPRLVVSHTLLLLFRQLGSGARSRTWLVRLLRPFRDPALPATYGQFSVLPRTRPFPARVHQGEFSVVPGRGRRHQGSARPAD